MSKRTIKFTAKTYKGNRGATATIDIKCPNYKLRQTAIKTDLGYFDISVSLDRWGRLHEVMIEPSKARYF